LAQDLENEKNKLKENINLLKTELEDNKDDYSRKILN
jgi:hypothetical protein